MGELPKDNYIYENLTRMKRLDLSGNELGYGVAPIPNSVHKLLNLEYLCDLCCSSCLPCNGIPSRRRVPLSTHVCLCRDLSDNAFTGEMPTFVIDKDKPFFKNIKHMCASHLRATAPVSTPSSQAELVAHLETPTYASFHATHATNISCHPATVVGQNSITSVILPGLGPACICVVLRTGVSLYSDCAGLMSPVLSAMLPTSVGSSA